MIFNTNKMIIRYYFDIKLIKLKLYKYYNKGNIFNTNGYDLNKKFNKNSINKFTNTYKIISLI